LNCVEKNRADTTCACFDNRVRFPFSSTCQSCD